MHPARTAVAIAALCSIAGLAHGQSDVFWANPDGGVWSEASNWSPATVPNNGKSLFNATLDLQNDPYQVDLDIDVELENFSLLWGGATLNLGSNSLTINRDLNLVRGLIVRNGSGSEAELSVGGQLRLEGGTIMDAGQISSNGSMLLTGSGGVIVCNTEVDHRGAGGIAWQGSGSLTIQNGGALRNGAGSRFSIVGSESRDIQGNGEGTLENNGVMTNSDATRVRGGGGATTFLSGVEFVNNGTVDLQGGGLILNSTNNLAPTGVLTTGVWNLRDGALLDFGDSVVNQLGAEVNISGSNSFFNGIQNLGEVREEGRFSVSDGQNFFANTNFTNRGEVEVGADSFFDTSEFGLGNLDGPGLFFGTFIVEGVFNTGAERIDLLAGDLTLIGTSSDFTGIEALDQIAGQGRFALENGRVFETEGNLDVSAAGRVRVGLDSQLTITGNLNNNSPGGLLSNGTFEVLGTLSAQNLIITEISNEVILDGVESRLLDGGGNDALAGLNRIAPSGILRLRNGRSLGDIGNLDVQGILSIEGGGPERSENSGFVRVAGDLLLSRTSTLEIVIDGATPELHGQVFAGRTLVESGAILSLVLGDEPRLSFGDVLVLLQTGDLVGRYENFLGLDIGNGLWFEVSQDSSGIYATVLPTPGGFGALGVLGILAARRRR